MVVIFRRRKSTLIAAAVVPSVRGITDGALTHTDAHTHIPINALNLKGKDISEHIK